MRQVVTALTLFLGLSIAPSIAFAQTAHPSVEEIRADIAQLNSIDGGAIGYAGTPGRFYQLYKQLIATGNRTLFDSLMADRNPIVHVMGALCIIARYPNDAEMTYRQMGLDSRRVAVTPTAEVKRRMTIAELFAAMRTNSAFLFLPGDPGTR